MARLMPALMLLALLVSRVLAAPLPEAPQAAMVVEVTGAVKTDLGETLELMQLLRVGTTLVLGPAARVRVTFKESGKREKLEGPGRVVIEEDGCYVESGSTKQTIEDERGTRVVVPRDENLRRMGGELQASLDNQMPALAYVDMSGTRTAVRPAVAQDPAAPKRITLFTSPALLPSKPVMLRWRGGPALFTITAKTSSGPLYREKLAGGEVRYRGPDLVPGLYTIQAGDAQRELLILSPYEANQIGLNPQLASRSDWLVRISQLIHCGLLDEAVAVTRRSLKLHTGDRELSLLLARLLKLQGKFQEAEELEQSL